jgi:serine protease
MGEVMKRTAVTICLCTLASYAAAQEYNGEFPRAQTTSADRIIVKWKNGTQAVSQQKMQQFSAKTGMALQKQGQIDARMDVLQLERRLSAQQLSEMIETLSADPAVEFAAPDLRRHVHTLPNDPLVSSQWYLLSTEVSALRAEPAWDVTMGSTGTVVAVLDTGVRYDHPDLLAASASGKLLPGYDFVSGETSSSFVGANDGNGRDADASDPGDWVSQSDLSAPGFGDCELSNSSWHGTRVAGVIAAKTNNTVGMAGASPNTWILPVRVMGKCGGRDSDIMAAARWAAGLSVAGVPDNPYPAKIINLSLGGSGTCTSAYQSVAAELAARGVLIVASAGNEGGAVSAPANCAGVLGVTGVRHIGTKVGFANLGPSVGIAAPGGNCVTTGGGQPCLFSIVTATDLGTTVPTTSSYTDQFNFNVGTSFSAPMVSGTAALMHAVNAKLGALELIERLQQSATPFPTNPNTGTTPTCHVPTTPTDIQDEECYCTTSTCGAGLLNANGAVNQAVRPATSIQLPAVIAPGQNVTLDASASAASCNRSIAGYEWSVVSSSGAQPALTSTNQPTTTVPAPASGEFVVRVTITDNTGAQDSADVTVTSTSASTTASPLVDGGACPTPITVSQTQDPPPSPAPTPPAPSAPSGGGGGGGTIGWELLALAVFGSRRFKRLRPTSVREYPSLPR